MATASNTPRKRNREDRFFNPGVQGRKTGLTIPQNARDELGIEAIGGIFSSPKKTSPARPAHGPSAQKSGRRSGLLSNGGEQADGDEIDLDTEIPDMLPPVQDQRRITSPRGKVALPPLRARSPMKTNLGSSPRRPPSMPPRSSPVPPIRFPIANVSSSPAMSTETMGIPTKLVNRRLNFSMDDKIATPRAAPPSVNKSRSSAWESHTPKDTPAASTRNVQSSAAARASTPRQKQESKILGGRGKQRGLIQQKKVAEPSEVEGEDELEEEDIDIDAYLRESYSIAHTSTNSLNGDQTNGEGGVPSDGNNEEKVEQLEPGYEVYPTEVDEDQQGEVEEEEEDDEEEKEEEEEDEEEEEERHEVPPPKLPKAGAKRGRKPKAQPQSTSPRATVIAQKRGVGRPPKRPLPVEVVSVDDSSHEAAAGSEGAPPAKRSRKGPHTKTPPSRRNPKARVVSKARGGAKDKTAIATVVTSDAPSPPASRPAPPKPAALIRKPTAPSKRDPVPAPSRSNYAIHLLSHPTEDPTAIRTRSGRTAIKPIEYWRGEKAIYNERQSLSAIVRTEAIDPPRQKARTGKYGGGTRRRSPRVESEDEDDDSKSDWEIEPGIIVGEVKGWDPTALASGEAVESTEAELAYAPSAITTLPVPSSAFRYLKTLGLPFFGSGVIDIPPLGSKNRKNSRKMQMAFFVFSGRVRVRVGGEVDALTGEWLGGKEFSISRGGVWQVPRGNLYAIWNDSEKVGGRLWFSQGCEIVVPPGESES